MRTLNFTFHPDQVRAILALFLVGSFVGMVPLFVFWGMPETSKEIVTYMMGQLSGMALMLLGNYSSKNAGEDTLNEKRLENQSEAIKAVKTNQSSDIIREGEQITLERHDDTK